MKNLVAVIDKHVECSLTTGPRHVRCAKPANSGVVNQAGAVYWRCSTHMGWIAEDKGQPTEYGHVAIWVAMK